MFKFVSFLHLQNRHEKHSKIDKNYKFDPNHSQNNITKHQSNIKKILHNNCATTTNTKPAKEKSSVVRYLKFVDEQHATDTPVAATSAPAAVAAKCCCQSNAGQLCRCSGNDRCATGASCTTTRCCCCCTCSTQCCSPARLWTTSTTTGCCCSYTTRRIPFCRLSTGICPIRQQLQWAHGAAFSNVSKLDYAECCSIPECLADQRTQSQKNIFYSSTCFTNDCSSNCSTASCSNICLECSSPTTTTATKLPSTSTKTSSILSPLMAFQMKLQFLTGRATNCC